MFPSLAKHYSQIHTAGNSGLISRYPIVGLFLELGSWRLPFAAVIGNMLLEKSLLVVAFDN